MISPRNRTDIDQQPTGLEYWVWRASEESGRAECYYLLYKGVELDVHSKRAARVTHDGREVYVEHDPMRHKGRGWKAKLCADIEKAVEAVLAGEGEETGQTFGDELRAEIARREAGEPNPQEHWYQWLDDDELPLLLAAWLFKAGLLSHRYEITRHDKLGFTPTSDEFNNGASAVSARTLLVTLQRLAMVRRDVGAV
jgi:hypothetical protein